MLDRCDAAVELDLVVDVGEPDRGRGHLDDDHRLRYQARGFVDLRRAGHHDVRDAALVTVRTNGNARTRVEDFAR